MRIRRVIIFIGAILLGLWSRSGWTKLPSFVNEYLGDVIWAFMVFYLLASIFVSLKTKTLFLYSFLFAYAIEFSQLYHANWIDSIRDIRLFALVLGKGFLWTDLLCYAVGIVIAFLTENVFVLLTTRKVPD